MLDASLPCLWSADKTGSVRGYSVGVENPEAVRVAVRRSAKNASALHMSEWRRCEEPHVWKGESVLADWVLPIYLQTYVGDPKEMLLRKARQAQNQRL